MAGSLFEGSGHILYVTKQRLFIRQASTRESPTMSGIVIIDNKVDKDTRFTDKRVSCSYLVANMVVAAATGALAAIVHATKTVEPTPHSHNAPTVISGIMISRSAITI